MTQTINYYLAVYIDILGQKNNLRKITSLPKNNEDEKKFSELLKNTAGKVKTLHDNFNAMFETQTKETKLDISKLTPEQQKIFKEARDPKLETLKFSDTIILYFTLNKKENITPFQSVYSALASTANVMILSLMKNTPLRGAIDIGIGTNLKESGLYGPILNNLHHMESKIAEYPRILISNNLVNMLQNGEEDLKNKTDHLSNIEKTMINNTKPLIRHDSDSLYILDYMNQPIKEALKKEHYNKILDFIEQEKRSFKENKELLSMYNKLKSYIRKYKGQWNNLDL